MITTLVMGLLSLGVFASSPSGLAVGEKIQAFLVKNCEGGDPYCQVCKYGKRPKLISVGDLSDPAWIEDLKALQTLHEKYSNDGKGLAVFALAASIHDGKATPVTDSEAALVRLKQIKEENKLTFPLVIAQNADEIYKAQGKANQGYKIFEDYYKVTESRTVMFGDKSNTVKYNAVLTGDTHKQLSELESVLQKSL
ncbi:MAG TPA: hypothetical protein VGR38_05730 [Candidatus Polarisedimenticolia bacterium]|nr:hypothetical protein [Candidatus Polarisedimenticolia bacterium]